MRQSTLSLMDAALSCARNVDISVHYDWNWDQQIMEYPSINKSMHAIEKLKEVLCSEVNIKSLRKCNQFLCFTVK